MGKKYAPFKETSKTNRLKSIGFMVVTVLLTAGLLTQYNQSVVHADKYDDQINAIQREVDEYNRQAAALNAQASSLENELSKLDAEAGIIQAQIDLNQARHDKLEAQITETEKEIDETSDTLGYIVVDKSMSDKISPIERLASSGSLSKYIDEETQRNALSDSLTDMINQIESLQKQLKQQKKEVDNLLKDQTQQRADLQAKQDEKQKIIEETRGNEDAYRGMASANNAKISELRAKQAEEIRNAAGGGSWQNQPGSVGGGGYPSNWANAPLDAYVDDWGLYTRECVSYAAWKVASTGRFVPHFGGAGNANQWPSTTSRYGIPNGSTPKAGSVAVWYIGYYGHVMYVEAVNGDGTITVSDYNLQWDGLYRKYTRSAAGLTYIYF